MERIQFLIADRGADHRYALAGDVRDGDAVLRRAVVGPAIGANSSARRRRPRATAAGDCRKIAERVR